MKLRNLLSQCIILSAFIFSANAHASKSSASIMKEVAQKEQNNIPNEGENINGVILKGIQRTPQFSPSLARTLRELERKSIAAYMKALKDPESDLTCTEKEARENIRNCLPDGAIQIAERYKATLNGEIVGYILEVYDHADADIIQDGSWIIIYLDKNMNVVAVYTGQS